MGRVENIDEKKGRYAKEGKPVYFNSNAYLGPVEKGQEHALPKQDHSRMLVAAEEKLLHTLILHAPARISLSTSLRYSTTEITWTSPERAWLYQRLTEDEVMYEAEQLKEYLTSRDDMPENAIGGYDASTNFAKREQNCIAESSVAKDEREDSASIFQGEGYEAHKPKLKQERSLPAVEAYDDSHIDDGFDPSMFEDSYDSIDMEQISLEDLEVIYESTEESSSKPKLNAVSLNPVSIDNGAGEAIVEINREAEAIKSEDSISKCDFNFPNKKIGLLDSLFSTTERDELLGSSESRDAKAEFVAQEALASMLRSAAMLKRESLCVEFTAALEVATESDDYSKAKEINEHLTEATNVARSLDAASKRMGRRMLDFTAGSGGLKDGKAVGPAEQLANEMDEWLNSLPPDFGSEYLDEDIKRFDSYADSEVNTNERERGPGRAIMNVNDMSSAEKESDVEDEFHEEDIVDIFE